MSFYFSLYVVSNLYFDDESVKFQRKRRGVIHQEFWEQEPHASTELGDTLRPFLPPSPSGHDDIIHLSHRQALWERLRRVRLQAAGPQQGVKLKKKE